MTVKDLIAKLSKAPQDAEIVVQSGFDLAQDTEMYSFVDETESTQAHALNSEYIDAYLGPETNIIVLHTVAGYRLTLQQRKDTIMKKLTYSKHLKNPVSSETVLESPLHEVITDAGSTVITAKLQEIPLSGSDCFHHLILEFMPLTDTDVVNTIRINTISKSDIKKIAKMFTSLAELL